MGEDARMGMHIKGRFPLRGPYPHAALGEMGMHIKGRFLLRGPYPHAAFGEMGMHIKGRFPLRGRKHNNIDGTESIETGIFIIDFDKVVKIPNTRPTTEKELSNILNQDMFSKEVKTLIQLELVDGNSLQLCSPNANMIFKCFILFYNYDCCKIKHSIYFILVKIHSSCFVGTYDNPKCPRNILTLDCA